MNPGFTGMNCEQDVDDCASSPCLNGARCEDQLNNYTCHCLPGYTGLLCEVDVDDCESNLCQNNATCLDLVHE